MMIEIVVNATDFLAKSPTHWGDIAFGIFIGLITLTTGGAMVYYFAWEYDQSQRRDPRESGISPLYEETCGGMYGRVLAGRPYRRIRFAFYDDFLIICGVRYFAPVCYCLPYEYISKVRRRFSFPTRYINITHRKHVMPPQIAIFTHDCAKVEKMLLELRARCKERKKQELAD